MKSTREDSQHLEKFVLPKVPPDLFATQTKKLHKVRNLISIAGGQDDIIATRFEFPRDGNEKGDVRRVVEIDPHSLFRRTCGFCSHFHEYFLPKDKVAPFHIFGST